MTRQKRILIITPVLVAAAFIFSTVAWAAETKGNARNGKLLYEKLRCFYCHKINGEGGDTGPDLSKIGAKGKGVEWQIKNLVDPSETHRKLKHPSPNMPKFDRLTDKMLLDLATFLESLK